MKKKLLLTLILTAVFTCLLVVGISAAPIAGYQQFEVELVNGSKITVYESANWDQWQGRLNLTDATYTEAPLDTETTYPLLDWSQVVVADFTNGHRMQLDSKTGEYVETYGTNGGYSMHLAAKNFTKDNATNLKKIITGNATLVLGGGTLGGFPALEEVVCSAKLKEIGYNALQNNNNLKTVDFSACTNFTTFGQQAFIGCTGLETIVLPDTITSMGSSVFQNCTSLKTIDWPSGMTTIPNSTFNGCTSLVFEIPSNITKIGSSAFKNCTSLTSLTIPDGVTELGDDTFSGCTSLELDFDITKLTVIGSNAFKGATYLVGELDLTNATKIGENAFANCVNITKVTVSNNLTSMSSSVFSGCTSLKTVNWSTNVTTIPNSTFNGCKNLEFEIPSNITKIGSSAFQNCDKIVSITVPDGVTELGAYAFSNCDNLEEVVISSNSLVTNKLVGIAEYCPKLTSFRIPPLVTELGYDNFRGCKSLAEIIWPNNLTAITGGQNFSNIAIKKMVLPNSLLTVAAGNFSGLEELRLGANLTYIGDGNWAYTTLKRVYIPASMTTLGGRMLGYTNSNDSSSNITFIFTGTKAEAEALQEYYRTHESNSSHAPNNKKFYDAILVSADEYDVTQEPSGFTFVYGYNACDAFYNGTHNEGAVEAKFKGADYVTDYVHASTCQRCQKNFVVDTICGPLFVDLGYSKCDDGTAFTYDLKLNKTNILTYEAKTGKTLNYGFIVGAYTEGDTGDIVDTNGNSTIQKSVVTDFAGVQFNNLDKYCLKMTGIKADQYEMLIYCNAYVLDGTAVSYMGAVKEDGKALAVSYQTLPAKQ